MNHTKALYKAIGKSILSRYAVYAVNLFSMMILARLFTPETFGTVAAIMVFFTFFQLMTEAGLGPSIINIKNLGAPDRNGLFGLTLTLGATFGAIFYFLTPLFISFYEVPRIDEVVPYVAISLVFFAMSIVPNAFLLRDQKFFLIASAGLTAEIVSTTVTVILAQWIDPLHALAAKTSVSAATNFLVIYSLSKNTQFGKPVWGTKFSAIKPLLSHTGYQFGFNSINYFSRNLDNILIGKYLGAGSLGVYDKAYQLMRYPLMLLTFAMTPAIQPVIRQYAGDKDKVEEVHRDFAFKLSLLGAVAGLALFSLADLVVEIMLGDQWRSVVPIIKILAIIIPVQVVLSTSGSFFQAMNRADILFLSGFLSAIVIVSAIIWGIYQRSMIAVCWALVFSFHINFIQAYYLMYSRLFEKSMTSFLVRMIPAALVVTGMTIFLLSSS